MTVGSRGAAVLAVGGFGRKHGYLGFAMRSCFRLPVPLAPLAEQRQIKKALEQTLSCHSTVCGIASQCRDEIKRLDESILAKAFRGELVPHGEPANGTPKRKRRRADA